MIWGMSTQTFTVVHVIISLVGIITGFLVLFGMIGGKRMDAMTAVFLVTTVLTSVTGFGFPFTHLLPSHKVGIISLVVLAVAIGARYGCRLKGVWRSLYVLTAAMALYLNVFVLVVQAFLKFPALHPYAPKGNEPPFLFAQLAVMIVFITLTIRALRGFHRAG